MKIVIIADQDIFNSTGGLQRAAKYFYTWLKESYDVDFIKSSDYIYRKNYKKSDTLFLIIGHRSINLLIISSIFTINKQDFFWCPFWHCYKLENKKYGILYKIFDSLFKFLFKKASLRFVVSNFEGNNISSGKKFVNIALPSNIIFDEKSINWENREFDLISVARDVPHKRLDFAKKLAVDMELSIKIVTPGKEFISDKDLKEHYLNSKVALIPSRYESYSLVAIEAISCGCSVVCSNNVFVKERLNKFENFFVCNDDNDWQNNITKALNNINDYSNKNRKKVMLELSEDNCRNMFMNAFHEYLRAPSVNN